MALRFSRLDRPAIRRLGPGEKLTEHGVTAERLSDGDTRYSVNVMVDGRRIHRVLGRESDGVTRTQCEEFIEKARTDAREGRLSLPSGRKLHLTFAAAADLYLKKLEEIGGKDYVNNEQAPCASIRSRPSLSKNFRRIAERRRCPSRPSTASWPLIDAWVEGWCGGRQSRRRYR
jgi:hypothetical protein